MESLDPLDPLDPCRFDERTARVLGLPLLAVTPTARLVANRTEWLWFDPAEGLAIWRGPDGRHGFPARSLEEALAWVGQVEGRALHRADDPS
jgi:hypothetical protein